MLARRTHGHARRSGQRRDRTHLFADLGVILVIFVGTCLTYALIRHFQVRLTGDEPHYLVSALAIGKFHSLHVDEAYRYAAAQHLFNISPVQTQIVISHHSSFAYHELGIPILLALPIALGGIFGAEVAFAAIVAVLTAALAILVGRASQMHSPWRLAVAGLFLSPAFLLAGTQIFPDLITGLLVAIVILFIANIEIEGFPAWLVLAVVGVILGYLPWLHVKNFAVAAVLVAALIVVWFRKKFGLRVLLVMAAPAITLWVLLLAYNSYVFGQWLGPSDVASHFGLATWTRIAALLIDRRQGIVIQLPAILLGLAGLWLFRRRVPMAALATAFVIPIIIILNGTLDNSFGGFSFVGRFQWEVAPVLLAFAGLTLLQLARARRRAFILIVTALGLSYVLEWIPVLANRHSFYNVGYWDPASYSGWWGFLDPFSPILGDFERPWGVVWHGDRVWLSIVFVVLLSSLVVYCLVTLAQKTASFRTSLLGVLTALVVLVGIATILAAPPLPVAEVFPASTLNSQVGVINGTTRVAQGPSGAGALAFGPFWSVLPGDYVATFRYSLQAPHTQLADVALSSPSATSQPVSLAQTHLPSTQAPSNATLHFAVHQEGYLQMRVFWAGSGRLELITITLRKVAG